MSSLDGVIEDFCGHCADRGQRERADRLQAALDKPSAATVAAPSSELLAAAEAVVEQTTPTAAYGCHDRLIDAIEAEKERLAEADHGDA